MKIAKNTFDAVIVGAGGAGLRAALELTNSGLKVAVLSKVFPTRSHTVSAQGGIAAALGNAHPDDWRWHMYDTVKGSDYLGDQDCIEFMCEHAPAAMYELEHMGMPFSRMENGKIYQRAFGGQTIDYGKAIAYRTCAAADRSGHALLHTLYQNNVKAKTEFYSEWYAVDLVRNLENNIAGVVAICIETGELVFFNSKVTILATGGAGRIYETKSSINTGWQNASFRGFADYMQTKEFFLGLKKLNQFLKSDKKTAIMCAEAVPWRCHRSLIADAETIRGIQVFDVFNRSTLKKHEITSFAVVDKSTKPIRIYYPDANLSF